MPKKLQRGTIYRTDGEAVLVKPIDGKEFTTKELQDAVNGWIEMVVPINKRSNLFVNEEGLIHNLPPNGHTESIMDLSRYPAGTVIRGNAISTYRVNPGEENDLGRMLVSEAKW